MASSAATLTWRGTPAGLTRFLELASRGPARVTDGGVVNDTATTEIYTAWVRMEVDSTGWMPENDFVALVRDEVPAHVRAELLVAGRRVWSSTGEPVHPAGARDDHTRDDTGTRDDTRDSAPDKETT